MLPGVVQGDHGASRGCRHQYYRADQYQDDPSHAWSPVHVCGDDREDARASERGIRHEEDHAADWRT